MTERGRDRDRREVTGDGGGGEGGRHERKKNIRKGGREEIAHRGGKEDGGKVQVDGLHFKAEHPAEVWRLTM